MWRRAWNRVVGRRGQTAVLGVVFALVLIVLTVGLVASGVLFPLVDTTEEPLVDAQPVVTTDNVTLVHTGGDVVHSTELEVFLRPGASEGVDFDGSYNSSRFVPGDTWSYESVNYNVGQRVRIWFVHEPSNAVLLKKTVWVVSPGGSGSDGGGGGGGGDGGGGDGSNSDPQASFDYSPSSPVVGETVSFNASNSADSDGNITSYEWAFGDGSSGSGETTTHTYSSSGSYNVTLTVTDDDGATATTSKTVNVTSGAGGSGGILAYRDNETGEAKTIDASGHVTNYPTNASTRVGQARYDLDGDGKRELPFIAENGDLRAIDTGGEVTVLFNSSAHSYSLLGAGSRIGVGNWTSGPPSVFAVSDNETLVHMQVGMSPHLVVKDSGGQSPSYIEAASVSGTADLNQDGDQDVVIVGTYERILYVEDSSTGGSERKVVYTGSSTQNNSKPSYEDNQDWMLGPPAQFQPDTEKEIPFHNLTHPYLRLADTEDPEYHFDNITDIKRSRLRFADLVGDSTLEVVYVDSNNYLKYVTMNGTTGFVETDTGKKVEVVVTDSPTETVFLV